MTPQIRMNSIAAFMGLVALYGCSPADGTGNATGDRQDDGWTTPPRIEAVSLNGRQAVIAGAASPEARVVLRGDGGEIYAVNADNSGRFELSVSMDNPSLVLIPEVQQGQDAIKGPQRLVIVAEAGLAVIQTDGGGSQRLTPGPALDAIDSDGRALVASGRGVAGETVRISVPGHFETAVKVGDDLRWSTGLTGVGGQGFALNVNSQVFAYPGPGALLKGDENQRFEVYGSGWRITRRIGDRAFLASWFPNP